MASWDQDPVVSGSSWQADPVVNTPWEADPIVVSQPDKPVSAKDSLNETLRVGFTPSLSFDTGIKTSPDVSAALTTMGGRIIGSYRGAKQILGVDNGEEAKNEALLRKLEADPEVGTSAKIGAFAGGIADPVTWAIPVAKAKSLIGLAGMGAVGGGAAGFLSPVVEGESRLENSLIGVAAGAIAAPVIGKAINAVSRGGAGLINKLGGDVTVPNKLTFLGTGDANFLIKHGIIKVPQEISADKAPVVAEQAAEMLAKESSDKAAKLFGNQTGFADPGIFSFILRPAIGAAVGYGLGDEEGAAIGAGVGMAFAMSRSKSAQAIAGKVTGILDKTVMNKIRENPIDTLAAATGAVAGWNTADDDASVLEKSGRGLVGAATAFLAYRAGKKLFPNMDDKIRGLVEDGYRLKDFPIYKELKIENKMFRNTAMTEFLEQVDDGISKLSASERKVAYQVLQGEAKSPTQVVTDFTDNTRKLITKYGQMMVDTGILDKDTFVKNVNSYIHREYLSKIDPTSKAAKAITNRVRIIGSELKPRGYVSDFPEQSIKEILANNPGARVEGAVRGGRQKVRFQLTKAQRTSLGEIEDVSYALARTGELMVNDVAAYKFFDDVSSKISFSPKTPTDVIPEGFIQVPDTIIRGTSVKAYGSLSGKYVPQNVLDDLQGMTRARRWLTGTEGESLRIAQTAANLYKKANTAWKISKTALNPVVHMNNIMSNNVLYDFGGGTYTSLTEGAGNILRKDAVYKQAQSLGVFDSDFVINELRANKDSILKDFITTHGQTNDPIGAASRLAKKSWGLSGGAMIKAYRAEDNIFRMGLFVERVKAGDTPEAAAMYAKRWMIDYDIDAPLINVLRHTTNPFISWSYRALPLVTETAVTKPWKIAKWGAYIYALNALGEKYGGGDTEQERRLMSERQKGTIFGMPFMPYQQVKLPTSLLSEDTRNKIGIGNTPQYQDITRFIPGGDLAEVSRGQMIPGLPSPIQPSGGVGGSLAQAALGFDAFSKQKLPGLGVNNISDAKIKSKFLAEQMLPNNPLVPGSYSYNKIVSASQGKPSPMKDNIPTWQAFIQGIGLKINPADVSVMKRRSIFSAKQELTAMKEQIYEQRRALTGGRITTEQYNNFQKEKVSEMRTRINKLAKDIGATKEDIEN